MMSLWKPVCFKSEICVSLWVFRIKTINANIRKRWLCVANALICTNALAVIFVFIFVPVKY